MPERVARRVSTGAVSGDDEVGAFMNTDDIDAPAQSETTEAGDVAPGCDLDEGPADRFGRCCPAMAQPRKVMPR